MDHLADWSFANPGHPVWLSDTDEGFVEATITSVKGSIVVVTTKGGKKVTVDADAPKKTSPRGRKPLDEPLRLLPRAAQTAEGVENMDDLNPLNEATIVANIESRFRMDLIYTRTGPILIAMNPFKRLNIYQDEIVRMYAGRPHGMLPPHCYQERNALTCRLRRALAVLHAQAEDAFQLLRRDGIDQSVIICGESGAGKTETTKKMLHYISAVARGETPEGRRIGAGPSTFRTNRNSMKRMDSAHSLLGLSLGERMVDSNALTEAFGNAKTVRNNNSSRFGKFTLFSFAKQHRSTISGGRIRTFLLEKSRVAQQPLNERNYHIFYQLLAGAPQAWHSKLHLAPPSTFHYLNQSGCMTAADIDDAEWFDATCDAMDKVQVSQDDQEAIFQVVAGVLHMGQVDFTALPDGESCEVTASKGPNAAVAVAASVLGLDVEALTQALITRVRVVPPKQETADQARDSRDALAKAIYSRLFDHLVHETNAAFDVDPDPNASFIGILDIFGFEDLQTNGFEQVFINYTNEKLQAIFNDATFRKEVEEYTREQIPFDRRDFPNNQPCLDLIEKKPMGLLPLIDSECLRGAVASDQSLVSKFHRAHQAHLHYAVCGPASGHRHSDGTLTNDSEFIIKHYAGLSSCQHPCDSPLRSPAPAIALPRRPIIYETAGFVDKNKDAVYDHLYDVVSRSTFPLVANLFPPRLGAPAAPGSTGTVAKESGPGKAVGQTVATRFTTSLNELTEVLNRTQSRFVRCVKTNNLLKPQIFDKPSVLRQLKTSGVMAALEIRRAGYPTRVPYGDFVKQFRVFDVSSAKELSNTAQRASLTGGAAPPSDRATAARMMTCPALVDVITPEQYRLGLTKIFFQADVLITLQTLKDRILLPYAVKIQHWWLRKQERIMEHKLTRAMHMVTNSVDRATIHGVQHISRVRRALEAAIGAVRYARGLGLLEPEVFRPALDRAMTSALAAREAVDAAAALKQHEARQRAQQLSDLDSGRARLGRITDGCALLTIDKVELEESVSTAAKAIEACRDELLRAAAPEPAMASPGQDAGGSGGVAHHARRKSVMQRTFTRAALLIEQAAGTVAAPATSAQTEEPDLERREQTCEEALALVETAEDLYAVLRGAQDRLERARSKGHDTLEKARAIASAARTLASAAGISDVAAVVAASNAVDAADTEALEALEGVVESRFEFAVGAAMETAERLAQIASREKAQKEEDDRRETGRTTLRAAAAKHAAAYDDAVALGVQGRAGLVKALSSYEGKMAEARLAEVGGASAFIAAADATLAAADTVQVALGAERQHKEACDRIRQGELARLEPPLAALAALEIRAADAGVAEEPTVVGAIADARAALESVRRNIERAEDASAAPLAAAIMSALSMAVATERAFSEAKQRKDALDREAAAAAHELNALDARLTELRASAAEDPEAGVALLTICDAPATAAAAAVADARRCVRKGDNAHDMEALTQIAAAKLRIRSQRVLSLTPPRTRHCCCCAARQVKEVEEATSQGKLRAAAFLRRRGAALAKLRACAESLQAARSSLVAANLQERTMDEVRTAMESADAALHASQQRALRPLVADMLQGDAAGADEEAAATEAARKVEAAEAVAARAVAAAERSAREWSAVAAALSAATERYSVMTAAALQAEVGGDSRVVAALEGAETAAGEANAAVTAGSTANTDPSGARHLVEAFGARLTALDATTTSAQRAKEAADRQRAAAKATLDGALLRLQGASATAIAAGPAVSALCRPVLDQANEAIVAAAWLRRRAADADGSNGAGAPEAVSVAAASALGKVAQAEQHLEEISASLAEAEEKARGIVVVAMGGTAAGTIPAEAATLLSDARASVTAARKLADDGQLQGPSGDMVADAAAAERAVAAAGHAVLAATEAVEAAAVRHQRAGGVVAELNAELDALVARHAAAAAPSASETAASDSNKDGIAALVEVLQHSPRFAAATAAVEAQIEAVLVAIGGAAAAAAAAESHGAAGPAAAAAASEALKSLRKKVQEEENEGLHERQRSVRRAAQAERAAAEGPALRRRVEAVKAMMRAAPCQSVGAAAKEAEEVAKASAGIAALDKLAALGHHATEEECVSVESVITMVAAAEAAVHRQAARIQRAESARRAALLRLEMCQTYFNELHHNSTALYNLAVQMTLAAASFAARCDRLPAALTTEADKEDITYWRTAAAEGAAGHAAAASSSGHHRSTSFLAGTVTSAALVAHAVTGVENVLAAARQRVTMGLFTWTDDLGYAVAAAAAMDRAHALVTAAQGLVQRQAVRLEGLMQQRAAAQSSLQSVSTRCMAAAASAEVAGVAACERVATPLRAAEAAIKVVVELIEKGGAAASPAALEEAQRMVAAADAATAKELKRREAVISGRRQARAEVKAAADGLEAAKARVATGANAATATALVAAADAALAKLHTAAATLVEDGDAAAAAAATASTATAWVAPRAVTEALRDAEQASSAMDAHHAQQRDMSRKEALKAAAARIAARRAELEEKASAEDAVRQRRHLQDDLERVANRLNMALPTVDEVTLAANEASAAVAAARALVSSEEAELSGTTAEAAAAALQGAGERIEGLEGTVRLMEASQRVAAATTAPTAASTEAYMGRTSAAFEALTSNMACLTQSLASMQQLMQHQTRVMQLQGQLLAGHGDRDALLKELATANLTAPPAPAAMTKGGIDLARAGDAAYVRMANA
ncbi:P-loop containing nucleoside triphosphate hydrolase protein [Tribonema minus]|uniref:P-loop containing nucleoside triphosphate hydrolase protein n=1 Tax=Tribonema minus TaxID=303371 RepID=A0A835ZIN6_9STRA|nr:P-loop containing nucleoside triphosphate hydrolase protein [Tribonema minus]